MTSDPQHDIAAETKTRLFCGTGSNTIEFQLSPGRNTIGRGPGNDIRLDDPSVSEAHCQLDVTDGRVIVEDLGSTNGTFVDSELVTSAVLRPGQTLRLGQVELSLEQPIAEHSDPLPLSLDQASPGPPRLRQLST